MHSPLQLSKNCRLETDKQQLVFSYQSEPVTLSFAETAILECLVQHQSEIQTKERLQDLGWPNRVVSATSLMQCISQLRKKLELETDIEIKTIPRYGYVLHLKRVNDQEKTSKSLHKKKLINKKKLIIISTLILITTVGHFVWQSRTTMPWLHSNNTITINGTVGNIDVYRDNKFPQPTDNQLQSIANIQIEPELSQNDAFSQFAGFALLNKTNNSFALCPNYANNQCPGDNLINISSDSQKGAHLLLSDFLATKIRMEQKTYNKLLLSDLTHINGNLKEEVYHADLYFKVQDTILVRADFRISLVHLESGTGIFYFAVCITDEHCSGTPIRFEIRGEFTQNHYVWLNQDIDVFNVNINKTELSSPNALSASAESLYLALRKQHLTEKTMTFYRVYQDNGTAAWIIPLQQYNMVWMQKLELHL